MQQTYVTNLQLRLLWHKAHKVGFSKECLRRMLTLLDLQPKTMTVDQFDTLLMYVNAANAKKFSY